MDVPQLSPELREALRTWFHSKDRSVYLADNTFAYLPGGVGYLSMAFISETILSASAASVTFSNIPQDFRHLMLFTVAQTDAAAESDQVILRLNNDSSTSYDSLVLLVLTTGITATAFRAATFARFGFCEAASSRGNAFSPSWGMIFNYAITGKEKDLWGIGMASGNVSADADLSSALRTTHWRNTNVVTSILLLPGTGPNFVSGSRFQLYGIL